MSNCYTTFYFELPIPNAEVAEKVETVLSAGDEFPSGDTAGLSEDTLSLLRDIFEEFDEYEELGFQWNLRSHGVGEDMKHNLEVYADESGNVGHAANLIEWLLPDLDIKAAGFEWASYGDGENGGGAFVAVKTNDDIAVEWVNTYQWLAEKLR